jgi:hypothetical protein
MRSLVTVLFLCSLTTPALAQTHRSTDPVIHHMWQVGMEQSQVEDLAQVLMDSIGPRLAGSPELASAQEWLVGLYRSWGVTVRKEQYGTWRGWRQGVLHVDLTSPRVQTLEAELLAWSPGGMVEGPVFAVPLGDPSAAADTARWLPRVRGRFVLISPPEPTCRAPQELLQNARRETAMRLLTLSDERQLQWSWSVALLGGDDALARRLEAAVRDGGRTRSSKGTRTAWSRSLSPARTTACSTVWKSGGSIPRSASTPRPRPWARCRSST